jgi:hypothetical protein
VFRLLQSIFNREDQRNGGYPVALIEKATVRAIDATDRRLHALSGHQKRLAVAVEHAVDHVMKMVDALESPLSASPSNYPESPLLRAMFASPGRMVEILSRDSALADARHSATGRGEEYYALLITQMSKRTYLGTDMVEDVIRKDVLQTSVSFDDHRLVEVTREEAQTRLQLKRRAYDVILRQILEELEERQSKKQALQGHRKLLRRKSELLKQAGWNLSAQPETKEDKASLEQKLQRVEDELSALGTPGETLDTHLELLKEALTAPGTLLSLEHATIILDRLNIERTTVDENTHPIPLQILKDRTGNQVVVALLKIDPKVLY